MSTSRVSGKILASFVGLLVLCLASALWFSVGPGLGRQERKAAEASSGPTVEDRTITGSGSVIVGRTRVEVVADPQPELSVRPAELSTSQARGLLELTRAGIAIGVPVHVGASQVGAGARYRLTRTYPKPLPRSTTASWTYFDEQLGTWIAVPSVVSQDRRTVRAGVNHLSLWTDIITGTNRGIQQVSQTFSEVTNAVGDTAGQVATWADEQFNNGAEALFVGVGALFDTRVDVPSCVGQPPMWARSTVFFADDQSNPIRWCVGHDKKNPDLLVVKARVNRGFGYGFETSAKPQWTYNSTDTDGALKRVLAIVGDLDKQIAASVYPLMFGGRLVGPGQEVSLGFSEEEVRAAGSDVPLVELGLPNAVGFLYSVLGQLALESGQLKLDGLLAVTLAFGDCANDLANHHQVLGIAKALLTCLTSADSQVAGLISEGLRRSGIEPRNAGRIAGKLIGKISIAAVAIGPVFNSFNYIGELSTGPEPRQLRVFPPVLQPGPAPTPAKYLIAPGAIGPYRPAMTVADGIASGLLLDVDPDCAVSWYTANDDLRPWQDDPDAFHDDPENVRLGTVSVVPGTANASRYRTVEGTRAGATVADLKRTYGSRLAQILAGRYQLPIDSYALITPAGSVVFVLDTYEGEAPVTLATKVWFIAVTDDTTVEDVAATMLNVDADNC